jgi:hypothetical protein
MTPIDESEIETFTAACKFVRVGFEMMGFKKRERKDGRGKAQKNRISI